MADSNTLVCIPFNSATERTTATPKAVTLTTCCTWWSPRKLNGGFPRDRKGQRSGSAFLDIRLAESLGHRRLTDKAGQQHYGQQIGQGLHCLHRDLAHTG
jgi:hypothetical protein